MTSPKRMNFWKSSKRPLTPPSFSENHVALFATKLRQKCVCSVWRDCCVLYDPISHEMHVVQQFNMVLPLNWLKTYPKKTLLYHFHAEKALFIDGQHDDDWREWERMLQSSTIKHLYLLLCHETTAAPKYNDFTFDLPFTLSVL